MTKKREDEIDWEKPTPVEYNERGEIVLPEELREVVGAQLRESVKTLVFEPGNVVQPFELDGVIYSGCKVKVEVKDARPVTEAAIQEALRLLEAGEIKVVMGAKEKSDDD